MEAADTVQEQSGSQTATSTTSFTSFEHAIVGTLYMAFALGGVVTNLLLILTFHKDKTLLRGASSWLHIGLALANIGVVAPSPLPASSSFSGRWLYGDAMCQVFGFEGMFVGLVAIGFVVCLCVERSVAKETLSASFYWMLTGVNVGNALFWSLMPLLGWSRYSLDPTGTHCAIEWMDPDQGCVSYMLMLCVFCFSLPMLLAVVSLYKAVPPSSRAEVPPPDASDAADSAATASRSGDGGCSTAQSDGFSESQLRWLCLTFLIMVVVGWGPFALLCLWAMTGHATGGMSMLASALPPLACKLMTMAYPLAYNVACPKFRAGYLSGFLWAGDAGAPGRSAQDSRKSE